MGSYLQMKNITKYFNDNKVLDNVDFCADKGQVHALVGENGAGKSTLMKILAGLFDKDLGDIYIDGRKVNIKSPKHAQELGIAMIHQDITLFPDLNITENIFIQREPVKKYKWFKYIDWKKAYKDTYKYLHYFGLKINPRTPINNLSIGQQRFIEIIKALSQNANIIIMDEPTAALTEHEIELLFKVIKDVKKLGCIVIYISHRLQEVKQIADIVTVIRDGKIIQTADVNQIDIHQLIRAVAGKEIQDKYPKLDVKIGDEVLRVQGLSFNQRICDINFGVKKGEILGITGLMGSGKRTLARVLFGIDGPYQGQIFINYKKFSRMTPHIAKMNGLCYLTGIETGEGLVSNTTVAQNITLTNLQRVSKLGFINKNTEYSLADDLIDRLEINVKSEDVVNKLSGGRQKKVIFAKWLFANAKILMIEEPTAGIDISSKVDVYNIINELVLSQAAVIIISTDFLEVMGMCDRILVMYDGRISKILDKKEATQQKILYYASGGK